MTEELKPCPFCGGAPTEHAIEPHTHAMMLGDFKMPDHEGAYVIECACGAGFVDDTREAVVTRWNTRTLTAAQPAQAAQVPEGWRDVIEKMVKGIDHLAELARQWEPDYSSGADRMGWVLAKNARDEAVDMLAAAQAKGADHD